MDLSLAGKHAVITGGASGIGLATTKLFCEEGGHATVWDRDPAVSTILAGEVVGDAHGVQCDITSSDAIRSAIRETIDRGGPIDCMVHSAAIGSGRFGFPFTNLSTGEWRDVVDVNILGTVELSSQIAEHMRENQGGSIVMVSSVAGQIGSQTDPPYSASKAAMINFAQCMAKDLAAQQIRVNTVCPGMVKTPLARSVWQAWHDQQIDRTQKTYDEWAEEKIKMLIPLQRWQQASEIAAMIVFLLSDQCRSITGQTINVDGGYVMHW